MTTPISGRNRVNAKELLCTPENAALIVKWADAVGASEVVRWGVGRSVYFARSGFKNGNNKYARENLDRTIQLAKDWTNSGERR